LNLKIDSLDDQDVMYEFITNRNEEINALIDKTQKGSKKYLDEQISFIEMHLYRDNLIGPGNECPYNTIIDYVEKKLTADV
jgi:hypothetical protein